MVVVAERFQAVEQDTVEFAVLDAAAPLRTLGLLADDRPRAARMAVEPFRRRAADLVDLFGTPEAGVPWWHRERARDLRREAHLHPVAAVTDAYLRVAARHIATAQLLEDEGGCWAQTA